MKLKNTIIAYNPGTAEIAVGPLLNHGDLDWTLPYEYTCGACDVEVREFTGIEARHRVMSDFIAIVVRDDVDLDAAHRAFWKIEEYRNAVPIDMKVPEEQNKTGA